MKIGICCGPDKAAAAARAGFEYIEWNVGALLKPFADRAVFEDALRQVKDSPLPCPAVNCFVPGELKITGPTADLAALERYVTVAFERAEAAGVQTIVFGSGGARQVPDGFPAAPATDQIADFCRMFAPLAQRHGVTVAVEPLNRAECNILTTVGESAALVRRVNHPAVRLLVDAYHFAKDSDSFGDLAASANLLSHVHLATIPNRVAPGVEPCDFSRFFRTLRKGGYTGRVSFEGKAPDSDAELARAAALMRSLAAGTS